MAKEDSETSREIPLPPTPPVPPLPTPRTEVIGVRLSSAQIEIVDLLVDAGLFKTRSEVVYWLVSEGLRTIPLEKLSSRLEEIKDLRGDAMREMRMGMNKARELFYEAFGEGYVHPLPGPGKTGWGTGLTTTATGPMGFDWDKLQIVMHGGSLRLPKEKGPYSEEEKKIMRMALQSNLMRMAENKEHERARLLKEKLEEALKETD